MGPKAGSVAAMGPVRKSSSAGAGARQGDTPLVLARQRLASEASDFEGDRGWLLKTVGEQFGGPFSIPAPRPTHTWKNYQLTPAPSPVAALWVLSRAVAAVAFTAAVVSMAGRSL